MGFDTECIMNIQSLPGEYFCPVCRTLVYPNEALQSRCTHLYCKPCLAYIVATTHACPYDGYLVTDADSKPLRESNNALADAIGKILVYCLYSRSGCQWQGTFSEYITHSTGCTFGNSLVVCNRCGTQIMHRQVHEHAHHCPGVQPQAQQMESGQTQTGTSTDQVVAQDQSVATSASLATFAAAGASSAVIGSMPGLTTVAVPVVASPFTTAATPACSVTATITATSSLGQSQVNGAAYPHPGNVPTAEQWYQQQQLQYQQYYQQYPGYNPYQQYQLYAQQLAYQQYVQSQMQVMLQNSFQGQHVLQPQAQPQASQNLQPHLYVQSQSSTQFQSRHQPMPQLQAQPPPQPHPQAYSQLQPQLHPHGQIQLHLQSHPQTQIAHLQAPKQPLPQTSFQPHPVAQGIQIQLQRPQVPAQQVHFQAPPQAHLVSLAPGPIQLFNQTHYPQLHLQSHAQGHQQPQAAAHQVQLESQPNAQVLPQHQQPHLPPQSHAYPSALPQHLIQQSNMHPNPQVIPQGQVQHPSTAVTGHQAYPQPSAIQQIPPGAPPQHPMFVQSQLQVAPFQHPQPPSQIQNQFPPQQPPHGHTPIQMQHQSVNPPQASLSGYPHQQHPPHPVQQMDQQSGMHSHAPQYSVLPSQAHSHFKPGQAHSQGLLPQGTANMPNLFILPQLQQSVPPQVQGFVNIQSHLAGGRPPMLGHAILQQPLLQSTSGGHGSLTSLSAASQPGVINKSCHVPETEAGVIPKESNERETNNSDQLRIESSASDDMNTKKLKYNGQSTGEIKVNAPCLPALTIETAIKQKNSGLSDDGSAPLSALKEATGHEEIRGIRIEVGNSTVAKDMIGEFSTQHVHHDNPSKESVPSQHGPSSEAPQNVCPAGLFPGVERYPQQIPYGHPSNFHTMQRLPAPHSAMVQERTFQELPPYQMQTQVHAMTPAQIRGSGPNSTETFPLQGQPAIIPGLFKPPRGQHSHNSNPFDAPYGGIPGAAVSHNSNPFDAPYGGIPGAAAPFSVAPPGHLTLPLNNLSEHGTAHFHVQSHMSMQHAMVTPFSGVPPGSDRLYNFPRPGNPFAPSGTSEYHLMDSMKRHRPGALSEDGHHFMDVLPPLRNPGNVHGQNAFGPQNPPTGFIGEPLGQNQHGFGSEYPLPDYSQEPGQFGSKRKPGSSCWCLICKVDCETVEGLDLHSQTREHQKITMDMVLSIKKENAKKPRISVGTTVRGEGSKSRKSAFGNKGRGSKRHC